MSLERVVRPYQTRINTPPVKLENAQEKTVQPTILKIGLSGSGKTLSGSYSSSLSVYQEKVAVEKTDGVSNFNNAAESDSQSGGGGSFSG